MRWARGTAVTALAGAIAASCGGSGKDYLGAAITAGVAVAAAAVNRAATDECWGSCGHGELCDAQTGLCVKAPPEGITMAPAPVSAVDCDPELDPACEPVDARAPGPAASAAPAPVGIPPLATAHGVDETLTDPCRGLCLSGERCVTENGVADCVAAGASP